jgi:hypothetical protein
VVPNEETNKETGVKKPVVAPDKVGEHKCAEVDALRPTPEREAKTEEK